MEKSEAHAILHLTIVSTNTKEVEGTLSERPLLKKGAENMSDSNAHGSCEYQSARMTSPFRLRVSKTFLVVSFLGSAFLAYLSGRLTHHLLIKAPQFKISEVYKRQSEASIRCIGRKPFKAPLLVAENGESVTFTRQSSLNFDASKHVATSSWFMNNEQLSRTSESKDDPLPGADSDEGMEDEEDEGEDENDGKEGPHSLVQHLMVDLKNVDKAFLNSEQQVVRAMLALIEEAGLELLSYQCHGFFPAGVSCVGILLQNYFTVHTWPEDGFITIDLCADESKEVLGLVPTVERLFGAPSDPSSPKQPIDQPTIRWAHKLQGFHQNHSGSNPFLTDLGLTVLADFADELKEKIVSVETEFQRIDIYDEIAPDDGNLSSYRKSLTGDDSYESQHPSLYRPNRVLFLDGWAQSSLHSEAAYHEALVHPALFAHPKPKRVAIIGGGEGATLREVFKHVTVKEAVMIEIDEALVNISRTYIPEWSDCSDLVGSSSWCIDDPRATLYYEDAIGWFLDRKSHDKKPDELFDVIIMDALDPEAAVPFAEALYGNYEFVSGVYNSLSNNGILVVQSGEAPEFGSPDENNSLFKNRAATTKLMEDLGFGSIHTYEESHCGFDMPWTYVVGFKSHETRNRWYANAATIDTEIRKRSVRTKSGASPFRVFDGPTMVSYQVPHRSTERVFCRRQPTPEECHLAHSDCLNAAASSLDTKLRESGEVTRGSRKTVFKYNPVVDRHRRQEDISRPILQG